MRYIMTFFWAIALVTMLNYVAGSIANVDFNFSAGIIVAVVAALLIIFLGESIPEGEVADH
ncbi:YjzD family protein [Sporosarcina sp. YIM B06819]|uniref:YjzD family protein n=1 Tax=Sporosarcina sp. YIM B06819 TaxID=3081769 RepID=UPI00298BE74F|nr:YjzD family protein [Sporosarcina sp. YIM B06819]